MTVGAPSRARLALSGFTLIELAIIAAIVGVLASLAVSAYETYTVRSEVEEGIRLATAVTSAVTDVYQQSGSLPAGRLEAGLGSDASDSHGSYVARIDVVNGRVDITFGNEAHAGISTATLSLTPYVAGDEVAWRCGQAPPPDGTLMTDGVNSAEYQAGNVDARYLPSTCR